METFRINRLNLVVEEGDLTRATTDAIVNAANETLLGGGGVDGAIHEAAGPQLLAACRELPELAPGVRCPTGEARSTLGFDLTARYVIHTVGPIYDTAERSAPLLTAAYRNSLACANELDLRSLAFPAISCGVFGYPIDEAAQIAVRTCVQAAGRVGEIRFVLFGRPTYERWIEAMPDLG